MKHLKMLRLKLLKLKKQQKSNISQLIYMDYKGIDGTLSLCFLRGLNMQIYAFNKFNSQIKSRELLIEVIKSYCTDNNIDLKEIKLVITGDEGQKPRLSGNLSDKIYFNVSHSGSYWICAVGDKEVGIDIQVTTPDSYEKICNRYFTDEEKLFVAENGKTGFFRIWTRKEAWAKYHGYSIFKVINAVNTVEKDRLKDIIRGISIKEIDLFKDSICTIAIKEDDDTICLKRI